MMSDERSGMTPPTSNTHTREPVSEMQLRKVPGPWLASDVTRMRRVLLVARNRKGIHDEESLWERLGPLSGFAAELCRSRGKSSISHRTPLMAQLTR